MIRVFSAVLLICSSILSATPTGTASAQTDLSAELLRSPKDGGPRRWQTVGDMSQSFSEPSTESQVVNTLTRGDVLANFGCSKVDEEFWCEIRPFRGGARSFVDSTELTPARGPDGVIAMGPGDSKRRARKRDFDATGEIPCAQEQGQALGKCTAAIARDDGSDATVVVTFPNGFKRQLFFIHGEFVSASATMSGVGTDIDWQQESGTHLIRVDDQRYELSETFVSGK